MTDEQQIRRYEAILELTSPLGVEVVRSYDKAWHRALCELPVPVSIHFVRLVEVKE